MKINLVKNPECHECDQDGITPAGDLCKCFTDPDNRFFNYLHEANVDLNLTWHEIRERLEESAMMSLLYVFLENPRQRHALEAKENAQCQQELAQAFAKLNTVYSLLTTRIREEFNCFVTDTVQHVAEDHALPQVPVSFVPTLHNKG